MIEEKLPVEAMEERIRELEQQLAKEKKAFHSFIYYD